MLILAKKNFINSHFFSLVIIFIFSISVNFYYSKFGAFPIDTFLHYDSSYRILNNEYPIRDFWIVSGFIVDIIQSIFFRLFGVNWFAYVLHSSLFNALISLLTYYFFISFKIGHINSLVYTLCFSLLAYTISGTPFVDHHAVLFSLAAIYLIILTFKNKFFFLWYFVVALFYLSFLSKQVPAVYILASVGIIVGLILIKEKRFKEIKLIFLCSAIFFLCAIFILYLLNIGLKDFYLQYFQYPKTIGNNRFINFDISYESFFNKYKFIVLPIFFICFAKFKQINRKNSRSQLIDNYNLLIFFIYFICILSHQILTKNQIFIYFLIPIFFALADYEFKKAKLKYKNYISIFLMLIITLITMKYHIRYNEDRKFHELENVNFNISIDAKKIDKTLKGLLWVNPYFKGEVSKEIELLKDAIDQLENSKSELMVITNYLFLDSITEKKLNYPNRTFTYDGASMPIKKNRFENDYKKFLLKKIKKQNIKEVYFFKHEKIPNNVITDNFAKKCLMLRDSDLFNIYILNCLD